MCLYPEQYKESCKAGTENCEASLECKSSVCECKDDHVWKKFKNSDGKDIQTCYHKDCKHFFYLTTKNDQRQLTNLQYFFQINKFLHQ